MSGYMSGRQDLAEETIPSQDEYEDIGCGDPIVIAGIANYNLTK